MDYINDKIAEDYLQWQQGESVFITSPTGSGKSTFILKTLLPYAAEQEKYIVYLCNRRILKNQLQEDASIELRNIFGEEYDDLSPNEKSWIHIETYQHCEATHQFPNFTIKPPKAPGRLSRKERYKETKKRTEAAVTLQERDILYYVFDEAHYFVSDALFNSETNYWMKKDFARPNSISIFLSATPEPLYCFLARRYRTPAFDLDKFFTDMNDLCKQRSKLRNLLHTPLYTASPVSLKKIEKNKPPSKPEGFIYEFADRQEIQEELKQINPCEPAFSFISEALKHSALKGHFYASEADYSYIDPVYFNEYEELTFEILNSDKKWLIFVDSESSGTELNAKLNILNCPSVFISASRVQTKKSGAYGAYQSLVANKQFPCKVLIATSVLDCGVSIKDEQLENIVISQLHKTEFLQMLGRVRNVDHKKIKLYIQCYSPNKISRLSLATEQKLEYMMQFYLLNKQQLRKVKDATAQSDGMAEFSCYSDDKKREIVRSFITPQYTALVYPNDTNSQKEKGYLTEYRISDTAFIHIIYTLKLYDDAIKASHDAKDPMFYLKEQLSWIGKSYSRFCWYQYNERIQKLIDFLDRISAVGFFPKTDFCREC